MVCLGGKQISPGWEHTSIPLVNDAKMLDAYISQTSSLDKNEKFLGPLPLKMLAETFPVPPCRKRNYESVIKHLDNIKNIR